MTPLWLLLISFEICFAKITMILMHRFSRCTNQHHCRKSSDCSGCRVEDNQTVSLVSNSIFLLFVTSPFPDENKVFTVRGRDRSVNDANFFLEANFVDGVNHDSGTKGIPKVSTFFRGSAGAKVSGAFGKLFGVVVDFFLEFQQLGGGSVLFHASAGNTLRRPNQDVRGANFLTPVLDHGHRVKEQPSIFGSHRRSLRHGG